MSECRQPYRLSNLLLVAESLTLMAGNSSELFAVISYRRWTPVVVSSETPRMPSAIAVQVFGCAASSRRSVSRITPHSSGSVSGLNDGMTPVFSYSFALCTNRVASPPSSTIRDGPPLSGQRRASTVHHQYSGSVSPFQANTGVPLGCAAVPPVSGRPTTTAAAA